MSKFSSWGLSVDGDLKPEILAPGGDIYSTINENSYVSMSGTSMATPHVAGAIALMSERADELNLSIHARLRAETQTRLCVSFDFSVLPA